MTPRNEMRPTTKRLFYLIPVVVSGVALVLSGFAVWSVTANRQLSDKELTTITHDVMDRVTLPRIENIADLEPARTTEREVRQEITFAALQQDKVPPQIRRTRDSVHTKEPEKYQVKIAVGEVAAGEGDDGVCAEITWRPRSEPTTSFPATSECEQ